MNSIKHFRDLSMAERLKIWGDLYLNSGALTIAEKLDGIRIEFRLTLGEKGFPSLEYKSYNSPFVRTGEEYLNWVGEKKTEKFAQYFAGVIDSLSKDQTFVSKVAASMILIDKKILTAELFSLSRMSLVDGRLKMVRIEYPRSITDSWDFAESTVFDHFVIFHEVNDQLTNLGLNTVRTFGTADFWNLPNQDEIRSQIANDSINEVVSTKRINKDRRALLNDLITKSVEEFFAKNIFPLVNGEGVVLKRGDKVLCKLVVPGFLELPLNSKLFGE